MYWPRLAKAASPTVMFPLPGEVWTSHEAKVSKDLKSEFSPSLSEVSVPYSFVHVHPETPKVGYQNVLIRSWDTRHFVIKKLSSFGWWVRTYMLPALASELIDTDGLLRVRHGRDPVRPDPPAGNVWPPDQKTSAHEEDEDEHEPDRVRQDHRPARFHNFTDHDVEHLADLSYPEL